MVAPVDGRGQGAADGLKEKSMGWLEKLRMRLRALRHGEEVHGESAEEWQFHIDLRTEENIRRGMTPEEARQSAEQHFGNAGYIKDVSWRRAGRRNHGNSLAGRAMRSSAVAEKPWIHICGAALAGTGDWRQRGYLQFDQHDSAAAVAD